MLLTGFLFVLAGCASRTYAQENPFGFLIQQESIDTQCSPLVSPFLSLTIQKNCPFIPQLQRSTISLPIKDTYKRPAVSFSLESALYSPPSPTPTITPTTTPSISPTQAVLASATQPATTDASPEVNDNGDLIFDLINQHRTAIGKAPFQKDENLCSLAQVRSTEMPAEIAHGTLHSGLYNRNLGYWVTEDAKYGSDENGTVNWWLHSPIHRAAIEGDSTNSCVRCTGTYCSALFTSYIPK